MIKLTIDSLRKNYGQKEALKGVSFTLYQGIYGLLGPNGSGKSTLMNILTGNLKATSGTVLWNEQKIAKLGKEYREILGYVPQQQALYPDFTAIRFLSYSRLQGYQQKSKEDLLALAVVELTGSKQKIKTLSGAQTAPLIAQSILAEPKFIMDEPTAD